MVLRRFYARCHIVLFLQAYEEISELRTIGKGEGKKILSILREISYTSVAIPTASKHSTEMPQHSCQVRAFCAPLDESQNAFRDVQKPHWAFRGLNRVVLISWLLC